MKKTLAIMLALIMVLALVPTVAFAADPVAWIGKTEYETWRSDTLGGAQKIEVEYKPVTDSTEK